MVHDGYLQIWHQPVSFFDFNWNCQSVKTITVYLPIHLNCLLIFVWQLLFIYLE